MKDAPSSSREEFPAPTCVHTLALKGADNITNVIRTTFLPAGAGFGVDKLPR